MSTIGADAGAGGRNPGRPRKHRQKGGRPRQMKNAVRISTFIECDDRKAAEEAARREGITLGEFVRRALKAHLRPFKAQRLSGELGA
jgi:hypothetical protein